MNRIIVCIWIFALIAPVNLHAQKNVLTETKSNTTQKDYKKIIIIGGGPLEARIFLDALTDELIKYFVSHHIEGQYVYEGNDTLTPWSQIKSLSIKDVDAILVFMPNDSLHNFNIAYKKRSNYLSPYVGTPHYRTYKQSVEYAETFGIQLFESKQEDISIWEATLKVDCDLDKKNHISGISKMIVSNLKKNKILL